LSCQSIEICGGIAYGKTTFAHALRALEYKPVLENFQANPFFDAFYQDPQSYAFETEITFTLQHYHQIKLAKAAGIQFASDFSPYLDLAYSLVTLQKTKRATYRRVYDELRRDIGTPDYLVRLECDPGVALERIRRRGRSAELGIELEYLVRLDQSINEVLEMETKSAKVIRIRSDELDFSSSPHDREKVLHLMRIALKDSLQ
jgi:deoxyadenosine/deoxycytidine kinase